MEQFKELSYKVAVYANFLIIISILNIIEYKGIV